LSIRILFCFVVSLAGLQAQLSDETAAAVDKLAAKALAESGTPAVSIAIVKDGRWRWRGPMETRGWIRRLRPQPGCAFPSAR
jgi:hypothetical protein